MSYSKAYTRTNWHNEPSTATPVNETNLNNMDAGVDTLDSRIVAMDGRIAALEGYETRVIAYAQSAENSKKDSEAWAVGKKDGVDVTSSDPQYHNSSKYHAEQASASAQTAAGHASDAGTSAGNASASATSASQSASSASDSATAAAGSASDASGYATSASNSADSASGSASSASTSANNAASSASSASDSATAASGSASSASDSATAASGSASSASDSATAASGSATQASGYATSAANSAEDSEAWAVGKRGGQDVPSTDPTHHNNAKYWAEQASQAAGGGVTSFNGRTGSVSPTDGDYDITQITPTSGASEGQIPILVNEGTTQAPNLKFQMQDVPSSGHTIKDSTTTFAQRKNLKFTGNVEVTDDSTNDVTEVEIKGDDSPLFIDSQGYISIDYDLVRTEV